MNRITFAAAAVFGVLTTAAGVASEPPATPAETAIGLQYRGNHVALRVDDLATAVEWWENIFGAREVRRSRVANLDPDIEIAFLHIAGGFHIELIGNGEPADPGAPDDIAADYGVAGWKHVGFLVADLGPVLARMARHGVEPDYRVTREDYGVEIVLIREPSGRFVELYTPLPTDEQQETKP